MTSKIVRGFVQKIVNYTYFFMNCFNESQLKCIKQTPYEERILHLDATGGLLKINNKQVKRLNPLNDYKLLLTYFGILKNKKFLSHPGEGVVPIIHFTSSEYYVENQCEALTQLKFKYLKYAGEQLKLELLSQIALGLPFTRY